MELCHLHYFVVVAEELNFTRAAERLHIAQPPPSWQIQQLEEEVGVRLFKRGSRPLKPTEVGRFLHTHTRQLLAQTAELAPMTQRVGQIERRLPIGFAASTPYGMLPKVIRRFRAEYPMVDLTMYEMTTMDQIQALKDGRIDVGFGCIRYEDPNVRRILLRDERLIVALPSGHALLGAKPTVSLRDLVGDTFIIYPRTPRPSYVDQVLALFHDHTLEPNKIYEARELQITLGLVAVGEGVSMALRSVAGLRREDVYYMELDDPQLVSPIIFSTRLLDESEDIQAMLALMYWLYDERNIPHYTPS